MSRPAPDLTAALALDAARLGPFGRVEHFAEVDSTNDLALARASAGAPHGTAVLADMQRAGRGRLGRAWFSPPGAGIYLSVVLRPASWGDRLPLITLAVGVAVARGLTAATGLPLELKWPNDIVVGRPWRKIAGILCESVTMEGRVEAVVAGIGINVRSSAYPPEIASRATALEIELGRDVDSAACVVEVLAALAQTTSELAAGRVASVLDEWRRFAMAGLDGAPVRWTGDHGEARGLARDVDATGALLVDDARGSRVRLIAGEVRWERLSGA